MIDIKKYICLYILNIFGIYNKFYFKDKKYLLNKTIKSESRNIDIYGLRFEKDDFYVNIFISETLENDKEYHCLVDIMGRLIGLAYCDEIDHHLITYINPIIKELDTNQILILCSSFNSLNELNITPSMVDIDETNLKLFKEYINHSMDIINSRENG